MASYSQGQATSPWAFLDSMPMGVALDLAVCLQGCLGRGCVLIWLPWALHLALTMKAYLGHDSCIPWPWLRSIHAVATSTWGLP